MTITVSSHVTDPQCIARANAHAASWQPIVGGLAGVFEIQHGRDLTCSQAHAHDSPFDRGLWIVANPRGCNVFVSNKSNSIDYAGAENHGAYRGGCTCGTGH
jgi:hypothetical protein